jgi:hypothetical protein
MSSRIHVPVTTMEIKRDEIYSWLDANAGNGSARYGGREGVINHWLNGEDYCYYNQFGSDNDISDTIFVFREERIATEFALRFA